MARKGVWLLDDVEEGSTLGVFADPTTAMTSVDGAWTKMADGVYMMSGPDGPLYILSWWTVQ